MSLPRIQLVGQHLPRPTVVVCGEALRPWRYAFRKRPSGSAPLSEWACRMVYLVRGRWVLKVDGKRRGIERQCAKEIRVWRSLDDEDRPHFAPLLAWQEPAKGQRGWVLQPRLRMRPGPLPRWGWRLVLRLADKYHLQDFRGERPSSILPINWCMVTRRGRAVPVIYDYGY